MNGRMRRPDDWSANSLLSALSKTATAELLTLGTQVEFEPGHVLVHENDESTHVYVLLDGCAKVTAVTPEGGFALLAIRAGGEVVGEVASLDDQPRSATVTTITRVHARVLSQAVFQNFLLRHGDAAVAISRSMGAKLRWATRRRTDFSGGRVRVRLARVLVELAPTYGWPAPEGIEIPLSQPELAAAVGAKEPSVHKVLAEFRRDGLISTGYGRITLLDLPRLREVAGTTNDPYAR